MTNCPFCGHENIEGVDTCDECQQPLADSHLHELGTAVERSLIDDRVDVLKPKAPIVVAGDKPVGQVLKLMVDKGIGCVIIVDGETPLGIFSERDALMRLNTDYAAMADQPVSNVMTSPPQTLVSDAKIAFATHRMDLGGYRHLPVLGPAEELVGIISVRDILRYLTEKMTASEA